MRVLWLEPLVGPTVAVACEASFLIAAMVPAARWVPFAVRLRRDFPSLALMGLGALVLQQVADLVAGVALRGMSPGDQLAQLGTPAGRIYATALVAFAAMPPLVNWRPKGRGALTE
jgi:hypothetical protein